MCGVSLTSSAGSPFCTHVIIASDGVILTEVQRSSLARIDHVVEESLGTRLGSPSCATSVC